MGRERHELSRQSNIQKKEKIIVLAFEGNDTERIYFQELKSSEKFNDHLIYLHLIIRNKTNTNSSPSHVFEELNNVKEEFNFDPTDELWMIIDTDRWKNIPEIITKCKDSKDKNMNVAVSNPCFELWLFLHCFSAVDLPEEEKQKIVENKRITTKKKYIDTLLATALGGSYNKSNPRHDCFINNIDEAISQAKALDSENEEYPKRMGSHVYKVVEKLLK